MVICLSEDCLWLNARVEVAFVLLIASRIYLVVCSHEVYLCLSAFIMKSVADNRMEIVCY